MRLFTALWPHSDAVGHLRSALEALDRDALEAATARTRGFRFVGDHRWHLTLCFHGDEADAEWLSDRITRRVRRLARRGPTAPQLRLAGCGSFRGVLWVGVQPVGERDEGILRALARAAGTNPHRFRAHITVARWNAGKIDKSQLCGLLEDYAGPSWVADQLLLVRSDPGTNGPKYEPVHREPLSPLR